MPQRHIELSDTLNFVDKQLSKKGVTDMKKVFLVMFLTASVITCSALSTASAGIRGGDKTRIDINVMGTPGGSPDYRATAVQLSDGNGNNGSATAFGRASARQLSKGKKNSGSAYADSSSKNNPNGDFAYPDGQAVATAINSNDGTAQSLFGGWDGAPTVIPQVQ